MIHLTREEENFYIQEFVSHIKNYENKKTENLINKAQINENEERNELYEKQALSNTRINTLLKKTQKKLKLNTQTKESRFSEKLKDFTHLDTFINIKDFLHDMNLTNNSEWSGIIEKIKRNLNENQEESPSLSQNPNKINEKTIKNYNSRILELKKTFNPPSKHTKNKKFLDITIGNYLFKKEAKGLCKERDKEIGFHQFLYEKIKNHELFQENQDFDHFLQDEERVKREVQLLNAFLERNKNENFFKEEIRKGIYLETFRNQADKIRTLLEKASRNIFNKKSKSIDEKLSNSKFQISDFIKKIKSELPSPQLCSSPKNNPQIQHPVDSSPKNNPQILRPAVDSKSILQIQQIQNPMDSSPKNKTRKNSLKVFFQNSSSKPNQISLTNPSPKLKATSKNSLNQTDLESPNYLERIIQRMSPKDQLEAKELLHRSEKTSSKLKHSLLEMKRNSLGKLQDFNHHNINEVQKFLIAEKNHNETKKLKKSMSIFLNQIDKNMAKNRIERQIIDKVCKHVVAESEKTYEKIFPKILEGLKVDKKREAMDLSKLRKQQKRTKKTKSLASEKNNDLFQ